MKFKNISQLKMGAILSYVAIAVNIISALIYSPWMLSKIGSGDYGLYTLSTSLINMFLLDFGISSAVTRFVSKYVATGEQEKANQMLGIVYKLFFIITAVIAVFLVVVYFYVDKIYVSLTPTEIERFKIVYIITALYSIVSFPLTTTLNGILTSYEKFIQIKLLDLFNKLGTVFLIVIALLNGFGLYALVSINALMNLFIFILKGLMIRKYTPIKIDFKFWDVAYLKEIFGFSIWVLINSICSRLIMNICPNILGITSGTLAITMFSFSSTIEAYSYMFASALDGLFMPRIAKITYKENDNNKLMDLMIKVGRYQYHLVGLIFIGFLLVGKEFILLWIGNQYVDVYLCAILLLIPAPFYLSQQIGKNTMVMQNKVKYLTYVNVIKAGLNVALVSVLSLYFGVIGACLSICIVYFFRNIANLYLYKTQLNLDIKRFIIECYKDMSVSMVISTLISLIFIYFVRINGWLGLCIKACLIIVIYIVCMYKIAYNETEKTLFKRIVKKVRR